MHDEEKKAVGISLGSTSLSIAVVHQHQNEQPEILAFDRVPCRYLRDGMIVNLEALQDALSTCRKNLANLVKPIFHEVTVNLCGVSLRSEVGSTRQERKRKTEIKRKHLFSDELCRPLIDDQEWRLIHMFPRTFDVDNQTNLASPVGMAGKTIAVHMQQIFAPSLVVENMLHAMNRLGFTVSHLVADPLPSIETLITDDEREMGMWLLDIGGSVIHIARVMRDDVTILNPLQLGGDTVTSDIAIGLNTTIKDAERIKVEFGCVLPELASEDVKVHIPPLGGGRSANPTSQHRLSEIIKSRMEEIFEMVAGHIESHQDTNHLTPCVVLTGGGSMLPGTIELASKYLGMPVIGGHLRGIAGLTDLASVPLMASAVGLALYGLRAARIIRWDVSGQSRFRLSIRKTLSWLGGS